jgi:hypothetical protein
MRVLITNLYISEGSGSEAVVELLADGLRRAGHQPMLYAPTVGPQAERMRRRGHLVVDRLAALPAKPDVIHAQHVTPALMAMAAFPATPVVYACHSAFFEVEAPRLHPQIRRWIAVDDLCAERCLSRGIPRERLQVVLNAVDAERFRPRPLLPARPLRALLLAKAGGHEYLVREACAEAGIALDLLGPATGRVTDRLEEELPAYDIVFATARMALEAAFVGCSVVVVDGRGFAGLLTTASLPAWRRLNFGAGALSRPASLDAMRAAIGAYDPVDAARVCASLREEAGAVAYAEAHLAIYAEACAETPPPPECLPAATAAWLEELLPSREDRAWREIARDLGSTQETPSARLELRLSAEVVGVEQRLSAEVARVEQRLSAEVAGVAQQLSAEAAQLEHNLRPELAQTAALVAALPGARLEYAARRLYRHVLPLALRIRIRQLLAGG